MFLEVGWQLIQKRVHQCTVNRDKKGKKKKTSTPNQQEASIEKARDDRSDKPDKVGNMSKKS